MTGARALRRAALCIAVAVAASSRIEAQVAAACNAGPVRAASRAAGLHPARMEARYGSLIAARRWRDVTRAFQLDVGTVFDSLEAESPSGTFENLEQTFRAALGQTLDSLEPALAASLQQRAASMHSGEFRQFEPFQDVDGSWRILQVDPTRPIGIVVSDSLKPEEYEAICWGGRSVSRLLGGINYETVPGALAHIEDLAREWERYRSNGPTQLIPELIVNRLVHRLIPPRGEARFEPPTFDLVLLHPFAGVELARRDNAVKEGESLAVETGGITVWLGGWKQYVGASWVLAYDADGRIGRGPLVRFSTFATAGVLWRRDAQGVSRRSLLLTVDLLRVLKSDATWQALEQTRAIAGKLLDNPLSNR